MIQLTNLTATPITLSPATPAKPLPAHKGKTVHNYRVVDGNPVSFTHSKHLITVKTPNGGCVCFQIADLITLAQSHDPLLCAPKPVDAPPKTP